MTEVLVVLKTSGEKALQEIRNSQISGFRGKSFRFRSFKDQYPDKFDKIMTSLANNRSAFGDGPAR